MEPKIGAVSKPSDPAEVLSLSYPYIVQKLVKIVSLIHEVKFEIANDESPPGIYWRGEGDAWLIVSRTADDAATAAEVELRILSFLEAEVAKNGRELCLVQSGKACVYLRRDGRRQASEIIPTEGLQLLVSSMKDDP